MNERFDMNNRTEQERCVPTSCERNTSKARCGVPIEQYSYSISDLRLRILRHRTKLTTSSLQETQTKLLRY